MYYYAQFTASLTDHRRTCLKKLSLLMISQTSVTLHYGGGPKLANGDIRCIIIAM